MKGGNFGFGESWEAKFWRSLVGELGNVGEIGEGYGFLFFGLGRYGTSQNNILGDPRTIHGKSSEINHRNS